MVKILIDHLYKGIGISAQFVVAYAIDRGEGLRRYGFDGGHILKGLIPENDEGRNASLLGQVRPFLRRN